MAIRTTFFDRLGGGTVFTARESTPEALRARIIALERSLANFRSIDACFCLEQEDFLELDRGLARKLCDLCRGNWRDRLHLGVDLQAFHLLDLDQDETELDAFIRAGIEAGFVSLIEIDSRLTDERPFTSATKKACSRALHYARISRSLAPCEPYCLVGPQSLKTSRTISEFLHRPKSDRAQSVLVVDDVGEKMALARLESLLASNPPSPGRTQVVARLRPGIENSGNSEDLFRLKCASPDLEYIRLTGPLELRFFLHRLKGEGIPHLLLEDEPDTPVVSTLGEGHFDWDRIWRKYVGYFGGAAHELTDSPEATEQLRALKSRMADNLERWRRLELADQQASLNEKSYIWLKHERFEIEGKVDKLLEEARAPRTQ